MYIATSGISLEIMNETSQTRGEYYHNLRYKSKFIIALIYSVFRGMYFVLYLRPKICELIPSVIWQIDSVSGYNPFMTEAVII